MNAATAHSPAAPNQAAVYSPVMSRTRPAVAEANATSKIPTTASSPAAVVWP